MSWNWIWCQKYFVLAFTERFYEFGFQDSVKIWRNPDRTGLNRTGLNWTEPDQTILSSSRCFKLFQMFWPRVGAETWSQTPHWSRPSMSPLPVSQQKKNRRDLRLRRQPDTEHDLRPLLALLISFLLSPGRVEPPGWSLKHPDGLFNGEL